MVADYELKALLSDETYGVYQALKWFRGVYSWWFHSDQIIYNSKKHFSIFLFYFYT